MAKLLDLPPEVIVLIINYMHPSCHLNFARVNKHCFQLSADVLARHAACHHQSQPWSDILPLTLPRLARMIHDDPIAAYYIHHLEFLGLRSSWDHWTALPFSDAHAGWNLPRDAASVDASNAGRAGRIFSQRDVCAMRQFLRQIPNLSEARWMQSLLDGNESHFKVLLIAMLPRLIHLTLVAPLPDLKRLLTSSLPSHTFLHLRHLVIAVRSTHWTADTPFLLNLEFLAAVYRLPALESLYAHVSSRFSSGRRGTASIPARRSPLKTLVLDGSPLPLQHILQMIVGAAALETYVNINGPPELGQVLGSLQKHHADTLQSLNLGVQREDDKFFRQLYSWNPKRPNLTVFRALKHVTLNVIAILSAATKVECYIHNIEPPFSFWDCRSDSRPLNFFSILPQTIETVTFTPMEDKWAISVSAAVILDKLVSDNLRTITLPNLAAVFLDDVVELREWSQAIREFFRRDFPDQAEREDVPWFQSTIAAGEERGVHVYTASTHSHAAVERKKREMGIPMPVTERDLETDVRRDADAFRRAAQEQALEVEALSTAQGFVP